MRLIYCVISYILPVMASIFDLPHTPMSESVHTSPTELLNSENVGVAVGIFLISGIEAELLRFSFVLPVLGGHL